MLFAGCGRCRPCISGPDMVRLFLRIHRSPGRSRDRSALRIPSVTDFEVQRSLSLRKHFAVHMLFEIVSRSDPSTPFLRLRWQVYRPRSGSVQATSPFTMSRHPYFSDGRNHGTCASSVATLFSGAPAAVPVPFHSGRHPRGCMRLALFHGGQYARDNFCLARVVREVEP